MRVGSWSSLSVLVESIFHSLNLLLQFKIVTCLSHNEHRAEFISIFFIAVSESPITIQLLKFLFSHREKKPNYFRKRFSTFWMWWSGLCPVSSHPPWAGFCKLDIELQPMWWIPRACKIWFMYLSNTSTSTWLVSTCTLVKLINFFHSRRVLIFFFQLQNNIINFPLLELLSLSCIFIVDWKYYLFLTSIALYWLYFILFLLSLRREGAFYNGNEVRAQVSKWPCLH